MKLMFFPSAFILSFFSTFISVAQTVTKTDSGFEYIHHIKNIGSKAQIGDWVTFKFDYYINDSLVVAWNYKAAPLELQMPSEDEQNSNSQFLFDAFSLMAKGDSLTLLVPSDSLTERPDELQLGDILEFELVLLDIMSSEDKIAAQEAIQKVRDSILVTVTAEARAALEAYNLNLLGENLISTNSGLRYTIHKEGSGKKALPGQTILLDLYGMLMDGTPTDNTYSQSNPLDIPLGMDRLPAGFEEVLTILPAGTIFTVFIPSHLAYGENGVSGIIPPNTDMVYHIHFIKVAYQD